MVALHQVSGAGSIRVSSRSSETEGRAAVAGTAKDGAAGVEEARAM